MNITQTILVVEDGISDQLLLAEAFRSNGVRNPIRVVNNGTEAIAYLEGRGKYADRVAFPYPAFIMTDVKMAGGAYGFDVLDYLRLHPECGVTPPVVFSASADKDDVQKAYMLGASGYLQKPSTFPQLKDLLSKLHDFWMACELPDMDENGKRLPTNGAGKPG